MTYHPFNVYSAMHYPLSYYPAIQYPGQPNFLNYPSPFVNRSEHKPNHPNVGKSFNLPQATAYGFNVFPHNRKDQMYYRDEAHEHPLSHEATHAGHYIPHITSHAPKHKPKTSTVVAYNSFESPLSPGMIAIGKLRNLFGELFVLHDDKPTNPYLKKFKLPDGNESLGIKVRIDNAISPYNPNLHGNFNLGTISNMVRDPEKYSTIRTSFEAVVCDFGRDAAFNDDHIDIFYYLPDNPSTHYLTPLTQSRVTLTIIDQNDPIVHPTLPS